MNKDLLGRQRTLGQTDIGPYNAFSISKLLSKKGRQHLTKTSAKLILGSTMSDPKSEVAQNNLTHREGENPSKKKKKSNLGRGRKPIKKM